MKDRKDRFAPIQDLEEAKKAYRATQLSPRTIWRMPDYDVMYPEFESDCNSFTEIANRYETSRERIRQIYSRFFSAHIPRRPDGRTRQRICARKTRVIKKEERQKLSVSNNPAISTLKSIVESLGLEVRIISLKGIGGRVISIGGKHCLVYSCSCLHRFGLDKNLYWSFSLNPLALKRSEFVVFATREGEKFRFFIVPTHKITAKFLEAKRITIYIPQKRVDSWNRRGRKSIIGIQQYENQWNFLIGQYSMYKKTASVSLVPLVPPSGPAF